MLQPLWDFSIANSHLLLTLCRCHPLYLTIPFPYSLPLVLSILWLSVKDTALNLPQNPLLWDYESQPSFPFTRAYPHPIWTSSIYSTRHLSLQPSQHQSKCRRHLLLSASLQLKDAGVVSFITLQRQYLSMYLLSWPEKQTFVNPQLNIKDIFKLGALNFFAFCDSPMLFPHFFIFRDIHLLGFPCKHGLMC